MAAAGRIRPGMLREANATFAIAWREILSAIRNPVSIAVTVIIPVIFMGILGGSISQNLGAGLPVRLPPVHAHRHDREHPLPGDDHGRHEPRRGARERLHGGAVRRPDLALHRAHGQDARRGGRRDGLADRRPRDDRRDADPDGPGRPAAGARARADPRGRRRRARRPVHRLRAGSEGRGPGRRPAGVPPDVPVGRADPVHQLDRPAGHPVQADADDLQHRPRAEHLLRGQAGVRVHRPPPVLARPRRHGRRVRRVHRASGP